MIDRKAEDAIRSFFRQDEKKALLVTGARQVGKTFSIRRVAKELFSTVVEFNLLEYAEARTFFAHAGNTEELIRGMTALAKQPMPQGETLVFIDEVQACSEIVTAVKFLVEDGRYRYVLSGSLLGVELKDIRSVPVGYMEEIRMYPLDLEEFARADGLQEDVLQHLTMCFEKSVPVDAVVHAQMMKLFRLYAIVGGMPAAVQTYLDTNDIGRVLAEQRAIITLYKRDIAQYDPEEKLYLEDIFSLIPSELNSQNKRFILKDLNQHAKFSRYQNSFIWLRDAGVALPCHVANEPREPLLLSKSTNLFKLFLVDAGLLTSLLEDDLQIRILNDATDINFGAIYENMVAQEFVAHGFSLYYYNNKKNGEVDFLLETGKGDILPIEVKSGKTYKRHNALNNLLTDDNDHIRSAYVLCNDNIRVKGSVIYCPVYMMMFFHKRKAPSPMVYSLRLDELKAPDSHSFSH